MPLARPVPRRHFNVKTVPGRGHGRRVTVTVSGGLGRGRGRLGGRRAQPVGCPGGSLRRACSELCHGRGRGPPVVPAT